MISAAIFDMDGIIIDSEPFWKEADIQAYAKVGLQLTEEQCAITTGFDIKSSIKYWYEKHPWKNRTFEEIKNDIESYVVNLVHQKGEPMEGIEYILNFLEERNIPIGLASSSSMHIILAVLDKLKIKSKFKIYHSAEFEIAGKPNPAVFLTAARKLGVAPNECLVFEDSINGVKAARAASMKVVAVPDVHSRDHINFQNADIILTSLSEFDEQKLLQLM
jgi:mannitol-1-/sugar-/sorbitol-6-/2-deoxyglucose-6-phosphatase